MLGVDEDFRAGDTASLAPTIARNLRDTGQTVATAETVTGGRIAAALSAAENAGDWFKGGFSPARRTETSGSSACRPVR